MVLNAIKYALIAAIGINAFFFVPEPLAWEAAGKLVLSWVLLRAAA